MSNHQTTTTTTTGAAAATMLTIPGKHDKRSRPTLDKYGGDDKSVGSTGSGRVRQSTSQTQLIVEEGYDENGNFFDIEESQHSNTHTKEMSNLMARMKHLGNSHDDDDDASFDFSNECSSDDDNVEDDAPTRSITDLKSRMREIEASNSEDRTIPLSTVGSSSSSPKSKGNNNNLPVENTMKKVLSWSTLTVREYPYVLGDNVTVMGPPISVDWKHQGENTFNLEQYENALNKNAARRSQSEMKIPSRIRTEILTKHGHTKKEIAAAIKQATITKNQRKRTVANLKMQPMEQFLEKVNRGARKNPFRKSKSDLAPFFEATPAGAVVAASSRRSEASGRPAKPILKKDKKANPKSLITRHSM